MRGGRRARSPFPRIDCNSNRGFTFRDARAIVDYLHDLGVSDCYASSYLKQCRQPAWIRRRRSDAFHPDIGTDDEYWTWIEALKSLGMGHVMDLVPNTWGSQSRESLVARRARKWAELALRALLRHRMASGEGRARRQSPDPILGDQYGSVLERQETAAGVPRWCFVVRYYDEALPIAPDTYAAILQIELDDWLEDQPAQTRTSWQSILTSSRNSPARGEREPESIAVRRA